MDGREISLLIGIPRPFSDGVNYYCPFQLKGYGDERVRYASGVDAIQALILCIDIASVYLETRPETQAGRLTWLGKIGVGSDASLR
ncbi:DUF6968 family protein [Luteibacter aegosomatissinici]|uniref:DUF6968 family protein n=1 Tax=Luteibacter aegosomatissinici TaxID=2911539 RepID=UPI001FFB7FA5|nr:hypothetical protein [Luteibacter aegosomatissinici]UPG93746.1 hypothetical protein L2Y97_18170 [Luteibacter aegosomatissinici]